MKNGRSLVSLAQELERQLHSKKDLVVPSALMRHDTDDTGQTRLVVEEDRRPGALRRHAVGAPPTGGQAEDSVCVLRTHAQRSQPVLLDRNVNTWLQSDDDRRMLRTLDGNVRAVLSDRYRRLDNYDLAESVLPILQRLPEVRFESVELTETRMYLKVVTPRLKHEMSPGDIVQAGVVVSNSEVGHGTLSVQPLMYRLRVPQRADRARLLAAQDPHRRAASATTRTPSRCSRTTPCSADDKAFFLKVRDVVEAAVSEATFLQAAQKLQKTLRIPLIGDPVKTVEVLATATRSTTQERSGVLRHLIAEGDLSGYGLVNAVTHYSQEVEDYDRATEFEVLGGKLIELPAGRVEGPGAKPPDRGACRSGPDPSRVRAARIRPGVRAVPHGNAVPTGPRAIASSLPNPMLWRTPIDTRPPPETSQSNPTTVPGQGPREDSTMNQVQLSDVQIANLTLLLTIRDGILHDRTAACCRFALDATQAERLGTMSVQQLMAIVANLGDATLFPPRRDLVSLLDTPLPLVRPLAAVHAPRHVTASSAA
jgi:hypothetical protein